LTNTVQKNDKRIPVTVITGFLGAGKTTLLNNLIADINTAKFAIIVNEFGDIGIDSELIETESEELIELSSGCICCVVRGDLIRALRALLIKKPFLEGIIIETTGLANPSPVIQTLIIDQVIGSQCRLDSVICVVDAINITDQLSLTNDASDQIAFSDHIVLNKTQDATKQVETIEEKVRNINPFARITKTNYGMVSSLEVLNQKGFDLASIQTEINNDKSIGLDNLVGKNDEHSHINKSGISSYSLSITAGPMNAEKVEKWLQDLLFRWGYDILRTKGVIWVSGEKRKLVIQAVNMLVEGDFGQLWNTDPPISRIVFIGRNLDREKLKTGFESCLQIQTCFKQGDETTF
tara:strand:- start:4234 stop:5283 length:1050 start_codon:yes stop_codon:yes gene_type:complete